MGISWWDGQQCCVASQTVAPLLDNDFLCDSQRVTLHLSGGSLNHPVWLIEFDRAQSKWRLIWLMRIILRLKAWNNSDAIKLVSSPYFAAMRNREGQLSVKQLIHHV